MLNELKKIAEFRDKLAKLKAEKADKLEQFKEDNAKLLGNIEVMQTLLDEKESEVKGLALEEYERDPTNKKLDYGMGIRVMNNIEYDDKDALEWCKEHGSICLTVDKKSFESLAKTQDIEFVVHSEKIIATIPQTIKLDESETV